MNETLLLRIKELEAERNELIEDVQARADIARQQAVRIQHLERALREIDQNTRLSVAELRAIARAAITNANADLLAALREIERDRLHNSTYLRRIARAAIAKAKGEDDE